VASRYLEAIRLLLRDPTSNLVATAIGLAIITLLALIIILLLLAWALPANDRRRPQSRRPGAFDGPGPPSRPARRSLPMWLLWVPSVLFVVVALGYAYVSTSTNTYCGRSCHTMLSLSDSWKASRHAKIRCIRCHEGRPGFSIGQAFVGRTHSVYLQLTATRVEGVTAVSSLLCLDCHGEIARRTIVTANSVAVSHKEILSAGASCEDCHRGAGHGKSSQVGMGPCLRCHDGRKVSVECTLCHLRGPDVSIRPRNATFGKINLPEKPTCGGCHAQKRCDACHGLRMPHPANYADPRSHARAAAFTGKDRLCFRCHPPLQCQQCHQDFNAHGSDWFERHKTYPTDTLYCEACHHTPDFCGVCHPKTR